MISKRQDMHIIFELGSSRFPIPRLQQLVIITYTTYTPNILPSIPPKLHVSIHSQTKSPDLIRPYIISHQTPFPHHQSLASPTARTTTAAANSPHYSRSGRKRNNRTLRRASPKCGITRQHRRWSSYSQSGTPDSASSTVAGHYNDGTSGLADSVGDWACEGGREERDREKNGWSHFLFLFFLQVYIMCRWGFHVVRMR